MRPPGPRRQIGQRLSFCVLFALVLLLAAYLRMSALDDRPMHTDEAIHAVKLGTLYDTGIYTYNPHEFHGPTLYYATLPLLWLSGIADYADIKDETLLRLVPALFGIGLILLLLLVRDAIGAPVLLLAGTLTAISPAMAFYSRYYIQEMLLVFFTFGAIAAGWRFTKTGKWPWVIVTGISLGLMYATKETSLIAHLAMIGAAVITKYWRTPSKGTAPQAPHTLEKKHIAVVCCTAAMVALVCLTEFFTQPKAALDALTTYAHYFDRATSGDSSTGESQIHRQPWYYYLQMLAYARYAPGPWWSEGLILALALVGFAAVFKAPTAQPTSGGPEQSQVAAHPISRFLATYTLLLLLAYSIIPYKTPWCLLGFHHGFIIMAGLGTVCLFRRFGRTTLTRLALSILLAAAAVQLWSQANRTVFKFASDSRNPYVYAHTSSNFLKLVKRIDALAAVHPEGTKMSLHVTVTADDYWPLPWYLRRYTNVGYWSTLPEGSQADVLILSPDLEEQLDPDQFAAYTGSYYGLRPDVLLVLYIRDTLWERFMQDRQ